MNGSVQEVETAVGEWVVRFNNPIDLADNLRVLESVRGLNKDAVFSKLSADQFGVIRGVDLTLAQMQAWAADDPDIAYIQPNFLYHTQAVPNDPSLSTLWGMNNTGQSGGTFDIDIDAFEAWDITTGSSDVVIAVIDTGIDYTHPDLVANIWENPGEIADNNIDDDGNGFIDDVNGWDFANDDSDPADDFAHGTHVAGTIGAKGNNALGVAGVNWNVSLMAIKFLDPFGFTSDAIDAVNYVTMMKRDHGINIVATNNSWGGGGFDQALLDAIEDGGDEDIVFVAAAGNANNNNDAFPSYPASYDSDAIISVAAIDRNGNRASFSNFGLTTVDLAAPGVSVLSTLPGGLYGQFSGTSMAAPHVTGVVGLLAARDPTLTPAEIKGLLLDSAVPIASMDGKSVTGGLLNANEALNLLEDQRISGTKFHDLDADGVRDNSEPGLEGWVILLDENGNGQVDPGEEFTTTDEDGNYIFNGLEAGTAYTVTEFQQEGWTQTAPVGGTYTITLGEGELASGADFGNAQLGQIAGRKFHDFDGDGIRDLNDTGLVNWTIFIDTNDDGDLDDGEPIAITDSLGNYSFANLPAGAYVVREVLQAGWMDSEPVNGVQNVNVALNEITDNVNFLSFQFTEISGIVFDDFDGDGVQDIDDGENGRAGIRVFLDDNDNDTFDVGENEVSTDGDGSYAFLNLTPGTYTVVVENPNSDIFGVVPASGSYTVDLTSAEVAPADFGIYTHASIRGLLFNDANGNATLDPGETGLFDWSVFLDTDGDGQFDAGEPENPTNLGGQFNFTKVAPGTYQVRQIVKDGFINVTPGNSLQTVTVTSGEVEDNLLFGNVAVSSIAGVKFKDLDGDGVQNIDAGETGLEGFQIFIDLDADGVLDAGEVSDPTDASGNYKFENLLPGTYSVAEVVPAGYRQTSPAGGAPHIVVLAAGTDVTGKDFGNFQFSQIAGVKFHDIDGDGVRDNSPNLEPGLPGWTIFLDANDNGTLDDGEVSTITGADGSFAFTNVAPGNYVIREVPQDGWGQSLPDNADGAYEVTIISGQSVSALNFGNYQFAQISGLKWLDVDGNGQLDTSLISGSEPDVVFIIDVSGSTSAPFIGSAVGDVNQDGLPNTVLDAELAGFIALNQQLIDLGLGDSARVGIVVFGISGVQLDMNGSAAGSPLVVSPELDTNNNGTPDVEEVLKSVQVGGFGAGGGTLFEPALQKAIATFDQIATESGNGNVVFLSDGFPGGFGSYEDEVQQLLAMNIKLRAFGVGEGAFLPSLQVIDPEAIVFTTTAELLEVFGGSEDGGALESGLGGVTIYLDLNNNGQRDDDEPIAGTSEDNVLTPEENEAGFYSFTGLRPGQYVVRELVPAGFEQTFPLDPDGNADPQEDPIGEGASLLGAHLLTLISGQTRNIINFGNTDLGSIAGVKFEDRDGDGRKDANEPGLSGWRIFLDADLDGEFDAGELFDITDANGAYLIEDVPAGDHVVREVLKENWSQTFPLNGDFDFDDFDENVLPSGDSYVVFLAIGDDIEGLDFGNFSAVEIHGVKFEDLNGDGVRNLGEPGLAGWVIFIDEDGDGTRDPIEPSVVTPADDPQTPDVDEAGTYSFTDLTPGQYNIGEVHQIGWTRSQPAGDGFYHLNLVSADNITADFGNFRPGQISGSKWNDLDGDGVRDIGESGLAVWTFFLDIDGNDAFDAGEPTAVSDADGDFSFANVTPGNYELREVRQTGWFQTFPLTGEHEVEETACHAIALQSGQSLTGFQFANVQLGSISGTVFGQYQLLPGQFLNAIGIPDFIVFLDTNTNGVLDEGERSAVTDSDGEYLFDELLPGSYTVAQQPRDLWAPLQEGSTDPQAVNLALGQNIVAIDFFNVPNGPDLNADIVALSLPDMVTVGDTGKGTLNIANFGIGAVNDTVSIRIYFSTDREVDGDDILLMEIPTQALNLAPGGSTNVKFSFTLTQDIDPDTYFVLAHVDTTDRVPEAREDNNVAVSDTDFEFGFFFGNVGDNGNRSITITDQQGHTLTLSLKGGSGEIVGGDIMQGIVLAGTTTRTTLRITTEDDAIVTIGDLTVLGSLSGVNAPDVNLGGDFNVTGMLRKARFHDMLGPSLITVGQWDGKSKLDLTFEQVNDLSVDSASPIGKFTAVNVANTDAQDDTIQAPWLNSLRVEDSFAANLNLTSSAAKKSLGSANIGRWLENAVIKGVNNMGKLTFGGIRNASVFSGVRNGFTTNEGLTPFLPDTPDDFANQQAAIDRVRLLGVEGSDFAWIDANVAAWTLKRVDLDRVMLDNDGLAHGLTAHQVGNYFRLHDIGFSPRSKNLVGSATTPDLFFDQESDFIARLV